MTGNNGNNGNNGNAGRGSAGIVGEFGGGWFIEDRVDLPFVTLPLPSVLLKEGEDALKQRENGEPAFNEFADRLGVPDRLGGLIRHTPRRFEDRQWTARWAAWRVLDPFARTDWFRAADDKMLLRWRQATDPNYTDRELLELARAARDERAAAMGEILSEDVEFITDFMALLSMTPASHPHTYGLLHVASQIGSYAAMHYKAKSDWEADHHGPRPRPSQLLPALLPPVPLPGHPAFPSGHATQSWLMAKCVTLALQIARMSLEDRAFTAAEPHLRIAVQTAWMDDHDTELSASDALRALLEKAAMVRGGANLGARGAEFLALLGRAGIDPSDADFKVTRDDLLALAVRIARNREIAGLHYPSDSAAGRMLAEVVLAQLTGLQELTGNAAFVTAVNEAAREWRDGE